LAHLFELLSLPLWKNLATSEVRLRSEFAVTLRETAQVLGVVASLIFVAIQIRNNARAVRAATYRQLTTS
jgi:hypothetical protein